MKSVCNYGRPSSVAPKMHLCVCEVRSVTLGNLKSPNIVKVSAGKCLVVPARYICGPKQVVAGYVMSRLGQ